MESSDSRHSKTIKVEENVTERSVVQNDQVAGSHFLMVTLSRYQMSPTEDHTITSILAPVPAEERKRTPPSQPTSETTLSLERISIGPRSPIRLNASAYKAPLVAASIASANLLLRARAVAVATMLVPRVREAISAKATGHNDLMATRNRSHRDRPKRPRLLQSRTIYQQAHREALFSNRR